LRAHENTSSSAFRIVATMSAVAGDVTSMPLQ
jgi:hypothetical protein